MSILTIQILNENEQSLNINKTFKIIIIGESGVGKSCLTLRATKNNYIENYTPTIGFENSSLFFKINENIIKFEIWDTCGQETYRSLIKSYYRNSSLVILVYSIDDEKSYNTLGSWIDNIKSFSEQNVKIFLVGNKIDISDENRKISKDMGHKFYKDNNLNYFIETSAKNGYNINNLFIEAARVLYEQNITNKDEKQNNSKSNDILVDNNNISKTCNYNCC